jgi:uncharacterized protein (TIGR02145 family)
LESIKTFKISQNHTLIKKSFPIFAPEFFFKKPQKMNNRFTSALFVLFALLLATCEKPERDNPWDEKNTLNPEAWAPQNFQVEDVTITEKKLTWSYDGDDRIEGFKLDRKKGDEAWQVGYQTFAKETRSWNDTEIIPGPSLFYEYRLYAYAGKNKSAEKSESIAVDFPPPTDLQLEKLSDISYKLIWQDNSTGEEGFKIDRKTADSVWNIGYGTVGPNETSFVDTNVFVGKSAIEVEYRVYAYHGNSASANITTSTESSLTAPVNLEISQLSLTAIKLEWQYIGRDEEGFKVERKYETGDWEPIGTTKETSYNDISFELNANAYYRVFAYIGEHSSSYVENNITTVFPPPTNLQLEKLTDVSYKLTWQDNSAGEEGFKIDRKTGDEEWAIGFGVVGSDVTSFVDTNVFVDKSSLNVEYRVYAFFDHFSSTYAVGSTSASLAPPENLQLTVNSQSEITLSWVHSGSGLHGFKIDKKTNEGAWQEEFAALLPAQNSFTDNAVNLEDNAYRYRVYAYFYNTTSEKVEKHISKPLVTTGSILNITGNSATGGGNVTSDGGSPVSQRGVCWSTSPNPTTSNHTTNNSNGTGTFTSNLTNLSPGTTYYVRAYAISSAGTSYGDQVTFSTVNLPTVITGGISNITTNSATGGGIVISDGGSPVTQRGVCWSTSPNPTISNHTTNNGSGTGAFASNITSLSPETTYYVRAYATNLVGTAYGNQLQFTTLIAPCIAFTDSRDGNYYTTVQIGNQCWMKENLKYLPSVSPPTNCSYTLPIYYVYGYQGSSVNSAKGTYNYQTYGVLYNWPAALNACPAGWHLPTDDEWTVLINYLGGSSLAGGKMKTTGTTHWNSPNTGATNESGFSGLPGGSLQSGGGLFIDLGENGGWWSSAESVFSTAISRLLYYNSTNVSRYGIGVERGLSVRCVRD